MASSATIWGKQVGTRPRLSIYWKAVRQDIPNNRTEIEATLRLHSSYSLNFSANKTGSLDGTAFTYTGGFSGTGQVNLSTKKFWVSHNSDGTKTQSISGSFNIAVKFSGSQLSSLSVSGNMSLERIPRGSALNSASITALKNGTSSSLTIGRTVHSSAFYHLVSIHDGDSWIWDSGYIKGTPSTTHTIPSSTVNTMLNRMSTVTSKSYTVRLRTYTGSGGSGLIGDVSRSMTASVHSDVKPSVNNPSVSIDGNRRDKTIGKYVQSFSKVKASVSGSAGYGSSVSTYSMTVRRVGGSDSQSISGSSGTTSRPVALSGNYEVIGTVTDTRGRSNTSRATFTVDAYSPPSITSFTAERDESEQPDESEQTKVNITRATTHSVLGGGGNNDLSYSVQRRIGTGSWTNVNTNGSGTITASPSSATSTSTGNAVTNSYEFRYVVTDQFGGRAESVVNVSTQRVVLDVHKNEGVGIGKIHERGVLDVDGEIFLRGSMEMTGIPTGGPAGNDFHFVMNPDYGNASIELGSLTTPSTPFIDFHSSGAGNDRDVRILAKNGWGNAEGTGDLDIVANIVDFVVRSNVRVNGNIIVNTGNNGNGSWVRFYDGTQICWNGYLGAIMQATDLYGEVYASASVSWTFPMSFISTPAILPSMRRTAGGAGWAGHSGGTSVTAVTALRILSTHNSTQGVLQPVAIGRWK